MRPLVRGATAVAAGFFAAGLIAAMLDLPPAPVRLPPLVMAGLAESGVEHPVTAVLLNFRGYDTLLEVAVLLLALFGIIALAPPIAGQGSDAAAEPVVQVVARLAAPLMVLTATYLLWAGAHRPGGAFQAGAVLAAAAVLLNLAGILPGRSGAGPALRLGLVAGFAVFLAVAAAGLAQGALLRYPPAQAGALILLVEGGLTLSLGLILASLFLSLSADTEGGR